MDRYDLLKIHLFEGVLNSLIGLWIEKLYNMIHVGRHERDLELKQLDEPVDFLLLNNCKAVCDESNT